ncbi:MAG: MATE family efflux transporter [Oscillospiraceae bacterium]|nr:MATE family efflux transporter [Oscillospiraceae bacterium]
MKNKTDFSQGAVWKVIIRMAIPLMLAQLVNVLYSVVDRMYIGHIPDVGSLALTGLGLTMPIVSIVMAFASLCSTGGGPLCSIARGRGDKEEAEKVMANCLSLVIIFSIIITVVLQLFAKPILYAFGASDDTYPYAAEYARIYIWGTIFAMTSLGMNCFINIQGFPTIGMLTVVIGAVVNIVLDPIFIFVLDWGISGAALATLISQAVSAAWAMSFLLGKKAILDLKLKNMVLQGKIVVRIISLGITGFIMSITNAIVQTACNTQLRLYGGDTYVGAMTIITSIREMTFMTVHGLTAGSQPVLGYNYGARLYSRVKQGIRFVFLSSVSYTIVAWALLMLLPETLTKIFNSESALVAAGARGMRIYFCAFIMMSFQLTGQSTFVGLGMSKQAVFFSLLRKVFIVVPLVYLLPLIPAMGADGVFWAEPISDFIGGVSCFAAMYFMVYKKMPRDGE